jgi:hypothetical protein
MLCSMQHISPLNSRFKGDPQNAWDLRRRTEITQVPVKDSHTRIKPSSLALVSGHGRYMTVAPERAFLPVGCWGWEMTCQ